MAIRFSRYKPLGWRNESHRHYLAAKYGSAGGVSKNRYFAGGFVNNAAKGNRDSGFLKSKYARGYTKEEALGELGLAPQKKQSSFAMPVQIQPVVEEPMYAQSAVEERLQFQGELNAGAVQEVPVASEMQMSDAVRPDWEEQVQDLPGATIMTPGVPGRAPPLFAKKGKNYFSGEEFDVDPLGLGRKPEVYHDYTGEQILWRHASPNANVVDVNVTPEQKLSVINANIRLAKEYGIPSEYAQMPISEMRSYPMAGAGLDVFEYDIKDVVE